MKKSSKGELAIAILIPLTTGALSSLFSGDMNLYSWINKPPLSPPGIVFPIVWTILYILMGISSYMIWLSNKNGSTKALNVYAAQLFFNFGWSIIFFRFSLYLLAFLWLLILIMLIVIMIKRFYEIDKTAAYLQIPYLIWCLFAAYLNFGIFILN